ncbi:alpha/beta fold hydrolase [Winogradskyella echinorum]|uniref:Alpha/beta fold hydrolase n=1 Tax=Winogradskyella echinorum TaxID=538189 RepID=A0ABR6XXN4_9FLAO|nr:alpha/beta fold hydrolase [Winogradskyella echinorum]MBC3845272.1 alpha/beta fold hydrolase [Winogradskyella echinorum]MBC5749620.1 alpha/beta fold hydrolase [Winogradskyella echinorum]
MEKLQYINISNYKTESGKSTSVNLSYQVFGKPLHSAPIVLVNHALTGNSTIIGENGWWNDLIGLNKCIDTATYTILAFNIPGNGFDSKSENLIENYKDFTARDIAKLFALGVEKLKITQLFAVIGGSVGGGIAWELAALKPNLIEHLIPVATDWKSTDWLIANCHIQDAILNHSKEPLADARMHAMTLYRTPESLKQKFDRTKKDNALFNIESWLNYHGDNLNNRFNLSAYKMMNQILRTIDITDKRGSFLEVASRITSNIHIITINSDLFFKPEENWNDYVELKSKKDNIYIHEIKSIHGHDAFLIEFDQLAKFLKPVFKVEKIPNKNLEKHVA